MSIANKPNSLSHNKINETKLVLDPASLQKPDQKSDESAVVQIMGGRNGIMAPLINDSGVKFPFSPSISYIVSSSYTPVELVHTNYEVNSFQKSSVQDLTLQQCRFSAETQQDADYMLAVITFFRTFTKMNYGLNDTLRGAPPRILRFSSYGDHMFNDVPVAIKSFTMPLDDNVDYVQTSHGTQVPILLNINLTLTFMPTPSQTTRDFSLTDFASGNLIKRGYI